MGDRQLPKIGDEVMFDEEIMLVTEIQTTQVLLLKRPPTPDLPDGDGVVFGVDLNAPNLKLKHKNPRQELFY